MSTCLTKSISNDVMKRIVPNKDQYMINKIPIAALYFKLLISKAQMDSRATTCNIRAKLVTLHVYIRKINFDISKFHEYVNELLTTLNACGLAVGTQNEHPLTLSLFEAHNVVPDVEFDSLISQKRSDYLLSSKNLEPRNL